MDGIPIYFSNWNSRVFSCSSRSMAYPKEIKKGLTRRKEALISTTRADYVCSGFLFMSKLYNNYPKQSIWRKNSNEN